MAFTTGPLGEEAGWRGYLLPRMLVRYPPVATSLMLGLVWAVWHYPLYVNSVFASGFWAAAFVINVVALTFLMTVLWHRTRGSLLLAVLFHWTVNVSPDVAGGLLPGIRIADATLRIYEVGTLLAVTALVVLATGGARLGATPAFVVDRDLAEESVESDRAGWPTGRA